MCALEVFKEITWINCQREGLSDLANIGKRLSVISFNANVTNLIQEGIHPVQPVHSVKEQSQATDQGAQKNTAITKFTVLIPKTGAFELHM